MGYEAYIDAWMLRTFPGRTLDELDDMDWVRLRRAQAAQQVIDIEEQRKLHRAGKLNDIDDDTLAAFLEHDALISETGNDGAE